MKIRVIRDPPIDPAHGVSVGAVYEVSRENTPRVGVWIKGEAGEVLLLWHPTAPEYEVTEP